MPLGIVIDMGVILLLLVSVVLCIAAIAVLARLTPPLMRSAKHLEKISGDAAAVSEDVTNDIAKTARNSAVASDSAVATLAHLEKISGDAAAESEAVSHDIARTARNAAIASENAVAALENLNKISSDAAAVSEDVTNDVAKTARHAATASENAVEASRNMLDASKEALSAALALAAIANVNIRGILTQVVESNVKDVKKLAEIAISHLPQGVSRVGSLFRRRGG